MLYVNHVIKGKFYEEIYRKVWSFTYNSIVKFHGKKNWEPEHDYNVSKSVL